MSKLELTTTCNDALNHAKTIAKSMKHTYVTTEHIFIALLEKSNPVRAVFTSLGMCDKTIKKATVQDTCNKHGKAAVDSTDSINFSPKISRVLTHAGIAAKRCNSPVIETRHILLGILEDDTGLVPEILNQLGIDIGDIQAAVQWLLMQRYLNHIHKKNTQDCLLTMQFHLDRNEAEKDLLIAS